jgi:magnesium transporter
MIRTMLYKPATQTCSPGGAEQLEAWQDDGGILWADFTDNPHDEERMLLMTHFGLHPLAIQDAQRPRHPPKIEAFDNHTFLLLKALSGAGQDLEFETIQLAMFVGERFLVTRRSGPSPGTDGLWEELRHDHVLMAAGPDALALRLSRIMVNRYLQRVLSLEPRLEALEEEMIVRPRDAILAELIGYKTSLKKFRRLFLYHVQVFSEMRTNRLPAIGANRIHEINDVYEQQERANSLASLYYELASDLIEGYISLASHRLNNIMKILTIITAIFVPLSFLAGIYGMNFEYMPELHSRSGYFILLGIMAAIATILLYLFRKKRWL